METSIRSKGLRELSVNMRKLSRGGLNIDTMVKKFTYDIHASLVAASPVGATGVFRGTWAVIHDTATGGDVLSRYRIVNDLAYAGPLDQGSPKGGKPWASAGPKTVEHEGRIFSSQAPEGVSSPIFDDPDISALSTDIAELIYKSL